MKTLALLLGLVGAALVLAAIGSASIVAQPSPIGHSSTFDSSNEGWRATSGASVRGATWEAVGGNPGGDISGEAFGPSQPVTFVSGASWVGNALGDYGGRLQVDLKASNTTTHVLIGFSSGNAGLEPCQDAGVVSQGWHTYSITLDASNLHDGCNGSGLGSPLTGAQVSAALAGFRSIVVRAVYTGNPIPFNLDNASLSGPQTPVTSPTGTITRKLTLAYTRHLFHGRIAADDLSCAATQKVTIFRKAKKPVKVGTATTVDDGTEKFTLRLKKVVKGFYYASAASSESPLDGNTCIAARSTGVRVR